MLVLSDKGSTPYLSAPCQLPLRGQPRSPAPTTGTTYPVCRGQRRHRRHFLLKTKGLTTSHVSALRPDLPQNLRLPGESWGRYRVKDITFCGKSARTAGHDTWERVLLRLPASRDDGFLRRVSTRPPHRSSVPGPDSASPIFPPRPSFRLGFIAFPGTPLRQRRHTTDSFSRAEAAAGAKPSPCLMPVVFAISSSILAARDARHKKDGKFSANRLL